MAEKVTTYNFIFSLLPENLKKFTSNVEELTRIDEKMMMSFEENEVLMYSIAGDSSINAFKSHLFTIDDYFEYKNEIGTNVDFIFKDAKKAFKVLQHFKEFDEEVKIKMVYNEDGYGEKLLIKNSRLKLEVHGGLPAVFPQKVTISQLREKLDTSKSKFSFNINKQDFEKIKKLSSIDKDNEFYSITLKDNKVLIGENSWTLEVDEIESQNEQISFLKKYFNTIKLENDEENIKLYVFPNFVLIETQKFRLMISTEITV